MTKFRTHGSDVHHPASRPRVRPNDAPANRIGVYNTRGQRVGHVGIHAGVSVARRLLGGAPAEIGKFKGRSAWTATAPELLGSRDGSRNQPTNAGGSPKATLDTKRAAQLRQAKGSVRK